MWGIPESGSSLRCGLDAPDLEAGAAGGTIGDRGAPVGGARDLVDDLEAEARAILVGCESAV